jgi:mycothiol system anti-sigma-R factor
MQCEEVLIRLWEYLDEELAPEEVEMVKAHLRRCPECHPAYCCDRAFLELLARQRSRCTAPARLLSRVRSLET